MSRSLTGKCHEIALAENAGPRAPPAGQGVIDKYLGARPRETTHGLRYGHGHRLLSNAVGITLLKRPPDA